jgi:hypothetical protein
VVDTRLRRVSPPGKAGAVIYCATGGGARLTSKLLDISPRVFRDLYLPRFPRVGALPESFA